VLPYGRVPLGARAGDCPLRLFGSNGYVVIRNPSELPKRLPMLYAQLTA
jgi:nitric oxide reductase NorD protein